MEERLPKNSMKPKKITAPEKIKKLPRVQNFKKDNARNSFQKSELVEKKREIMEKSEKTETAQQAPKTIAFSLKKELIGDASDDLHFFVSDGTKLKNLKELAEAFETMHEDTFKYHSNESKNDFATWTKTVFGEHELSEKLAKADSKQAAHIAVLKHIVNKI